MTGRLATTPRIVAQNERRTCRDLEVAQGPEARELRDEEGRELLHEVVHRLHVGIERAP
jgi:hypothetical protein